MNDVETVQKELEDKLFDFIEENFGKKRHECFNQVMSFINNNNFISDLMEYDEYTQDLEIDNEELESHIEDLYYSFNSLKASLTFSTVANLFIVALALFLLILEVLLIFIINLEKNQILFI